MTETPRHVEIRNGGQVVAAAEVTMPAAGTARTSLHAAAGHVAPGWRADLVDAVMDLPEVRASQRLEATVPLGDVRVPRAPARAHHRRGHPPGGLDPAAGRDDPAPAPTGTLDGLAVVTVRPSSRRA